ncbi:molybdopterin-guanine dinucleotide biosynthesis protein B [Halomonas sp. WWR20]
MALSLETLNTPLLGIAAWSGTGKTTLLESLLPRLTARNVRVAVIKHAHHRFDVDQPGKDSHRLRSAGAVPMVVASSQRFALMMETPGQEEADLGAMIAQVEPLAPALILVEGFKEWPIPKLELHRVSLGKPLLAGEDAWVRAAAVQGDVEVPYDVERLDLDDHDAIAEWVAAWPARWMRMRSGPRQSCAAEPDS